MPKNGPILIVEDDYEDQEIIHDIFSHLGINNKLLFFSTCTETLDYLHTTQDKPFIIFSDINMPGMNGLELKRKIDASEYLKRKSIPFIFLTTSSTITDVNKAYDFVVQGYFVKKESFDEYKKMMEKIIVYWKECRHPNS
jgi:CheY-like chemotaxis protein